MTLQSLPVIQLDPVIIRRNAVQRVSISLVDCEDNPVDASALTLRVLDPSDCPIYCEDFFAQMYLPFVHRVVKVSGAIGQFFIDWGNTQTPPIVLGVGGSYPTGFAGGETLLIQIDNQVISTVFQSTDQTLTQVVARINSFWGPIWGTGIASINGNQIQIQGHRPGPGGRLVLPTPGTSPTVATTLGLTVPTILYGTQRIGESDCTNCLLFEWTATDATHPSELTQVLQTVYVLPGGLWRMLPQLRLEIDKAVKLVSKPDGMFLGYTDAMLFQYLLGGLQSINAYQPSIFFTPDNFPYQQFGSTLVEAALLWGVTSQTLFAVDSDVPSYSDQGQSFVINHQAPLAAYLNNLAARLDRNIPLFKLHFVNTGTVLTEMGPSFRLNMLLDAAPSGALFRNVYFKS
jgi:hypothetical protein